MIEWSETELMIRDAIREFVDTEVRPNIDQLEFGDLPPYEIIRKLFTSFGIGAMSKDAFDRSMARSEGGAPSGESSGGDGDRAGLMAVVVGELSKVCMGLVTAMGVSVGLTATTIMSRGSREQKLRWVPDLLTFDKVGAWAITEPDAGSDAFGGMKTTARPVGGGGGGSNASRGRNQQSYVLNGQKTFITNGPYADTIVVYAKLDDGGDTDRRKRPVLTFVLDSGMPGLTQSKPFRKMGIHSSPTGELFFADVAVSADRLLGSASEHGDGRDSARSNFTTERVGIAHMSLGIIEECLRLSVDYAKSRELWGQRIGDFQLIQLKLANMEIARLNVQNLVFRAIELSRAGRAPSLAEASAMKLYASQAATEVAMEAVQLFGGNGYMSEYRVEQLARDAKSLMIYAGSNEIQVTHVARALLT